LTGCDRRRHPANGTPDALRSVDCTGCAAHTIAYLSQGLRALPANLIRTRGNFDVLSARGLRQLAGFDTDRLPADPRHAAARHRP